ncbi:hypothetical protein [Streptomyces venezuelae]|uniref:hypothetical protein n=1 Tax=Streptomyces venezuelae TaxID=54571 RepID=UPI001CC246E1|nr:hypothetical protein [Streptomyces venezuelae]
MREVAGRYERVHGHLTSWANELEGFQTEADDVLRRAKEKQDELETEKAKKVDSGGKETPKPSAGGTDHDPLQEYRNQLAGITSDRDTRAGHHAGKIKGEIDDVIEDSWWDDLKGWFHDNADWIKTVLDGLGWIATIAGIVAIWIPGLNALVLGIAILTILTRSMLVASGDASWTDLAFDIGGLLLMGIGRGGIRMLKGANKVTSAAAQTSRTAGLKAGLRSHKGMLNDLSRAMSGAQDDVSRKFFSDLRRFTLKKISRDTGWWPRARPRYPRPPSGCTSVTTRRPGSSASSAPTRVPSPTPSREARPSSATLDTWHPWVPRTVAWASMSWTNR